MLNFHSVLIFFVDDLWEFARKVLAVIAILKKTYFVLVAQELYHTLESLVHLCKRFWLPQGQRKIQSHKHNRQTHQNLEYNPK